MMAGDPSKLRRAGGPVRDVIAALDASTLTEEPQSRTDASDGGLQPALTVLCHPDPRRIGERALLPELTRGQKVALSRIAPLFAPVQIAAQGQPLADQRLSRKPVHLEPGSDGGVRLISGAYGGKLRYRGVDVKDQRDISAAELADGGVLEMGGVVALVLHQSRELVPASDSGMALLGHSHRMQTVRATLRRLAASDAAVLIRGETGTGKELAAQALHTLSGRAARPFVAVNLGALPPSLAAAELFGAERGAFTGAVARQPGYFQQARGGTLFLDELGEAPPEVQVLLLRVVETGEVRALGAAAAQKYDARLIAATDADLDMLLREGAFRRPLLHRLSTCELHLPPLRQRREDIGILVLHLLRAECAAQRQPFLLDRPDIETAPWLPLRVLSSLAAYDWPGNVRELRNVVRQMVLASAEKLSLELPPLLAAETPPAPPRPLAPTELRKPPTARRRPADISEAELLAALEQNRWDLTATAAALDIARASLYMLLDKAPHIRTARNLSDEDLVRSHCECGGDLDVMVDRLRVSRNALERRLRERHLR